MKSKILLFALGLAGFASCVETEIKDIVVEKPADIEAMEYLNDYDVLKSYVNRTASPEFKLGCALNAADFIKQEQVYTLAASNFDELTAGNAMKYSSIVSDNGTMDFTTVRNFVASAESAGMTIYGHTLAWHSQQNNKYLNGLIADKEIEVDPDAKIEVVDYELDCSTLSTYNWTGAPGTVETTWNTDGGMAIYNPEPTANWWDLQYWLVNGIALEVGKAYKIAITCRAEGESDANVRFKLGDWSNGETKNFFVPVGRDYAEVIVDITPAIASNGLFFQHGDFVGTIYWKSMKIYHEDTPTLSWFESLIENGDAEGDTATSVTSTHVDGSGNGPCDIVAGAGVDGSNAYVVTSNGAAVNPWDTQLFVSSSKALKEGDKIKLSFDYRADIPNSAESQAHGEPGAYIHWDAGCALSLSTEWKHFEKVITVSSTISPSENFKTFAWNLDVGAADAPANKYYFDNIELGIEVSGNTIPLTDEEKKEVLTNAMDTWIAAMMEATEGKVTTWDAVNEAISGRDADGDGYYDLQSVTLGTVSEESAASSFYWQDYLGYEDYVRIVVNQARKHYAENGGTEPLKLFINDYNLESDWDDNKKLKSLIHWIEIWESDGVTKIDGIGSQMHVSCYENENTQSSKEAHVVKMLELLASTGKLVKISELDMGYVDANGNSVATSSMTEEQHKKMAEFYKFIVSKYFEIIPAAQQYGICQWCITDAPGELGSGGWRNGEPVGLWDLSYNRKHTYAGFAEGLKSNK